VRTLKLTLWYDGTAYAGWQRQDDRPTVQGVLEASIAAIEGGAVAVTGAGRTDAGVHAAGQVASVVVSSRLPTDQLRRAINARLPDDVRVVDVAEAAHAFNAQYDAVAKTYRYAIWNAPEPHPFIRHVTWHVGDALDVNAMVRAAGLVIGEHDFAAFQAKGSSVATTVRRVISSELRAVDLDTGEVVPAQLFSNSRLLRYEITGNGFLRHMVRTIVGTLVDIGRGRWPPDDLSRMLASRDRSLAGPTAPPQGLMLWRVEYE
jgi:tRNA pseudouridine38-40 synthase